MFDIPFLDLPPFAAAAGTVSLPGSKSISNRVLLLSALCESRTTVHDLLDSDDTRVMLDALRELGCGVDLKNNTVVIAGMGGSPDTSSASLFMGNAGTAMRPLTAALAVIGGDFELHGVSRMHERPIGDLVDALRQLGCKVDYTGTEGYPPLKIGKPEGALKLDAPIKVRGDVSSQFLTALLMALPLVAARDIVIEVVGELISRPYIEITLNLLSRFGVDVVRDEWRRFTIPVGSRYKSPGEIHVEADASSASYFIALGAIAEPAPLLQMESTLDVVSGVRIEGVGASSIQGDIRFLEAAEAMGAKIRSGANWIEVSRGVFPLRAIDLDCNHIPDAAMTLAVMALYADGPSTLRNIASWRVKETDRIAAMAAELRKIGATVEEGVDFIRITPPATPADWRTASIHTYDDHRVAMCFSLAALNKTVREGFPPITIRIEDPKCVAKTFPDYFEAFFSLAAIAPSNVPVICVDGPTASGKGTLASTLAHQLGFHYLDSGALYRIVALAAIRAGFVLEPRDESAIAALARKLPVKFAGSHVFLDGEDVSDAIRTEEGGMNASKVSALPEVRTALVALQHSFRTLPGLVADGRDMGTVIFPSAPLKIYLTASASQRAERRHKQLISKGFSPTIDALRADLEARDARDSNRSIAPLKPAEDAMLLDNSSLSVQESVSLVLDWWQAKQLSGISEIFN